MTQTKDIKIRVIQEGVMNCSKYQSSSMTHFQTGMTLTKGDVYSCPMKLIDCCVLDATDSDIYPATDFSKKILCTSCKERGYKSTAGCHPCGFLRF